MEVRKLTDNLLRLAASEEVSHAYILEGSPEGTFGAALKFAEALVSTKADLLLPEHEKPNLFSVEDVREQITGTVYIRPYGTGKKVYIVREAGKMNIQAQNALLKTIEEPPEYVVILLLAENAENFLETIRSRCVRLNVNQEAEEVSGNDGELIGRLEKILMTGKRPETGEILAFSSAFGKEKIRAEECFLYLKQWFRDVLYAKAGETGAGGRSRSTAVRSYASAMSYEDINRILEKIDEGQARIMANVNPELTMEMVLTAIQEVL